MSKIIVNKGVDFNNMKYLFAVAITGSLIGIFGVLSMDPVFAQTLSQFSDNFNVVVTPTDTDQNNSEKNKDSTIGRVEGPFKVAEVIDGDTILLDTGIRVRYLYVDTPETKKPDTPVQCYGPEASDYNKKMVLGKNVRLVSDKDPRDQYGRDLRVVFLEGRNTSDFKQSINADLVEYGLARAKFYSPNFMYRDEVNSLEKTAKNQLLGLWGACKDIK